MEHNVNTSGSSNADDIKYLIFSSLIAISKRENVNLGICFKA